MGFGDPLHYPAYDQRVTTDDDDDEIEDCINDRCDCGEDDWYDMYMDYTIDK